MKYILWVALFSIATGTFFVVMHRSLDLSYDSLFWFLIGSCICFYSFAYVEALDVLKKWWKSEPKFKGFKYWIKVSFRNLLKLKKEDVKTALAVIIGAMVK